MSMYDATLTCATVAPLLPLAPHAGLTPQQEAHVRDHLATCQECQQRLARLQELDQTLQGCYANFMQTVPALTLPSSLHHTGAEVPMVHKARRKAVSTPSMRMASVRLIAPFAAAILIAGIIFALFHTHVAGPGAGSGGHSTALPPQTEILSIAMTSADEGWVAGYVQSEQQNQGQETPFLAHLAHGQWRQEALPWHEGALTWIVMTSNQDGWAGSGGLLHYSQGQWREVPAVSYGGGSLRVTQALSAIDVWGVHTLGSQTLIAHYDGTTWHDQALPLAPGMVLRNFQFADANDGWALVTASDEVLHTIQAKTSMDYSQLWQFANGRWSPQFARPGVLLQSVGVTTSGDAWAVGINYPTQNAVVVLRWVGNQWESVSAQPFAHLTVHHQMRLIVGADIWLYADDLRSNSDSRLFFHFNGAQWESIPNPLPQVGAGLIPLVVIPHTADQAWFFGLPSASAFVIYHYISGAWVKETYTYTGSA